MIGLATLDESGAGAPRNLAGAIRGSSFSALVMRAWRRCRSRSCRHGLPAITYRFAQKLSFYGLFKKVGGGSRVKLAEKLSMQGDDFPSWVAAGQFLLEALYVNN